MENKVDRCNNISTYFYKRTSQSVCKVCHKSYSFGSTLFYRGHYRKNHPSFFSMIKAGYTYDEAKQRMPNLIKKRLQHPVNRSLKENHICNGAFEQTPEAVTDSPIPSNKSIQSSEQLQVWTVESPAATSPDKSKNDSLLNDSVKVKKTLHNVEFLTYFQKLQQNERYIDVKLCAEGRLIKCHRLVLSSVSEHFESILKDFPVNEVPIIYLNSVPFWVLDTLVQYMYTGEFEVETEKLPELQKVAKDLKVNGFEAAIIQSQTTGNANFCSSQATNNSLQNNSIGNTPERSPILKKGFFNGITPKKWKDSVNEDLVQYANQVDNQNTLSLTNSSNNGSHVSPTSPKNIKRLESNGVTTTTTDQNDEKSVQSASIDSETPSLSLSDTTSPRSPSCKRLNFDKNDIIVHMARSKKGSGLSTHNAEWRTYIGAVNTLPQHTELPNFGSTEKKDNETRRQSPRTKEGSRSNGTNVAEVQFSNPTVFEKTTANINNSLSGDSSVCSSHGSGNGSNDPQLLNKKKNSKSFRKRSEIYLLTDTFKKEEISAKLSSTIVDFENLNPTFSDNAELSLTEPSDNKILRSKSSSSLTQSQQLSASSNRRKNKSTLRLQSVSPEKKDDAGLSPAKNRSRSRSENTLMEGLEMKKTSMEPTPSTLIENNSESSTLANLSVTNSSKQESLLDEHSPTTRRDVRNVMQQDQNLLVTKVPQRSRYNKTEAALSNGVEIKSIRVKDTKLNNSFAASIGERHSRRRRPKSIGVITDVVKDGIIVLNTFKNKPSLLTNLNETTSNNRPRDDADVDVQIPRKRRRSPDKKNDPIESIIDVSTCAETLSKDGLKDNKIIVEEQVPRKTRRLVGRKTDSIEAILKDVEKTCLSNKKVKLVEVVIPKRREPKTGVQSNVLEKNTSNDALMDSNKVSIVNRLSAPDLIGGDKKNSESFIDIETPKQWNRPKSLGSFEIESVNVESIFDIDKKVCPNTKSKNNKAKLSQKKLSDETLNSSTSEVGFSPLHKYLKLKPVTTSLKRKALKVKEKRRSEKASALMLFIKNASSNILKTRRKVAIGSKQRHRNKTNVVKKMCENTGTQSKKDLNVFDFVTESDAPKELPNANPHFSESQKIGVSRDSTKKTHIHLKVNRAVKKNRTRKPKDGKATKKYSNNLKNKEYYKMIVDSCKNKKLMVKLPQTNFK